MTEHMGGNAKSRQLAEGYRRVAGALRESARWMYQTARAGGAVGRQVGGGLPRRRSRRARLPDTCLGRAVGRGHVRCDGAVAECLRQADGGQATRGGRTDRQPALEEEPQRRAGVRRPCHTACSPRSVRWIRTPCRRTGQKTCRTEIGPGTRRQLAAGRSGLQELADAVAPGLPCAGGPGAGLPSPGDARVGLLGGRRVNAESGGTWGDRGRDPDPRRRATSGPSRPRPPPGYTTRRGCTVEPQPSCGRRRSATCARSWDA
ncbi:hypothetical protein ACU686_06205 [Yinghuangia aomiensis]